MKALDPVTLAVLNGRLVQIADEMDATLFRSAFNPIIAEAHDACHGLYHAETGATLVQGTSGLPIFVGAMAFAVKTVIDKVARDGDLDPRDTYLFNDPYDGGTHLNDVRLVRPLMRDGKVFAWLASVGHWLDVGGNVPGNFNAKATESFQEGFRIPPVKLVRGGIIQQDIVDILAANSRVPQSNWGDLNGQLNALDLGERRLNALLDEYGGETISSALAALSARAEALMRANIAALPDGTYRCDDFLDNDGVTDRPLKIALDLTIAGDRMTLDFSRSAPPCDGPLNIARSTTVACCYVALKHLFTDVPANAGCLAPIEFVIPGHDAARRLGAAPGRRLHRDDPARDRHDLRRVRESRAGARERQPVRDHQRALARGLARARPALGDVLLLRRRARRQSGRRRAQPRQQPDLDRDHSAAGNSGVALSGDVHPMGAAAGLAAGRGNIAAGLARSTRSRRWPTAARKSFFSASAANIRRPARTAAARRRSTGSSMRPTTGNRRRRSFRRSPT